MKYKNSKIEVRVLELEDTVALLTRIVGTMSQMLSTLNQITERQTDMIATMMGSSTTNRFNFNPIEMFREAMLPCPSPNPEDCGSCARDDDTPPWSKYDL